MTAKNRKLHQLTACQLAMEFALWIESSGKLPTTQTAAAAVERFGCSKATAYRLIQFYRDAKRLPEPDCTDRWAAARRALADRREAA